MTDLRSRSEYAALMAWKVLITAKSMDEVGDGAIDLLVKAGCEVVFPKNSRPLNEAHLLEELAGVDAVLAGTDSFSASVLASREAESLKIISRWGVGYDEIDVAAATEKGVVIAYTPGMLNDSVADYAFALLLSVARGVHEGHLGMAAGNWAPRWGAQVYGKTIGIVGCGRIGRALARRGAGFDHRVIGYDIAPHPDVAEVGIELVPLDQLLEESDFVSLHVALTEDNLGLIGERELRLMKPSAFLINTARGELVDETALDEALRSGWIGGAAIDAYSREPLPEGHVFYSTPNLLLSPHQASRDRGTGDQVSLASAQAIVDLMQKRRPQSVVDTDVFSSQNLRS